MYLLERHISSEHTNTASARQHQDKYPQPQQLKSQEDSLRLKISKSQKDFFPEDLQKETRCLVSISKPLNNAKIRNLSSPILPSLRSVSNSAFENLFASPVRMPVRSAPEPITPSQAMGEPKALQVDLAMWRVCPKRGAGTRCVQTRCPQEKALVSRTCKAQGVGGINTPLPMHAISKWI